MLKSNNREILPQNIKISNYKLTLFPNFDSFKFQGEEIIKFKVVNDTNIITLNSHEIDVYDAVISQTSEKCIDIQYDKTTQRVMIIFESMLTSGNEYDIIVSYSGIHNDQMNGFYRSKYTDQYGIDKYLVTTQFEATYARQAFLCVDEPSSKATFDISLTVPINLTALSNMPEKTSLCTVNEDEGTKTVTFETTPIMSTYLLAFFVGEVDYIEKFTKRKNGDQIRVRVYSPPLKSSEGAFALDLTCKTLDFFADYFDVDYPLPKMDLIAIPDFAAGAMENWGLVTFRTKYLLYNEKTTSAQMKTLIAEIVCHELAHQWFGNLVTMEWWSDLWLNEGFATWAAFMATNEFFPEWKMWENFVTNEHNNAIELDQLSTSHPISNDVKKATEVNEIFDAITYSKGACVIRMLADFLGEIPFRDGLRKYLNKYQYKNAQTSDLWDSLSEVSGKNVAEMMDSWINTVGFPLVEVKCCTKTQSLKCNIIDDCIINDQSHSSGVCGCVDSDSSSCGSGSVDNDGPGAGSDIREFNISQTKFVQSLAVNKTTPSSMNWVIPLNILTKSSGIIRTEMFDSNMTMKVNGLVKLNTQNSGFYLTKYDDECLKMLSRMIWFLNPLDRAELIDTLFVLASTGHTSIRKPLRFLKSYIGTCESDYLTCGAISSGMGKIRNVWYDNQLVDEYVRNFMHKLLTPIFRSLGWTPMNGETHQTSQLRVLSINCIIYNDDLMEEAISRFYEYLSGDTTRLHSDIRGSVFKLMVKYDDKYVKTLMDYYPSVDSNEIQTEILRAIGIVKDIDILKEALDFSFVSNIVRPQDAYIVSVYASMSDTGREYNWKYIVENWNVISKLYNGGMSIFGRIISYALENLVNEDLLNRAVSFLDGKKGELLEVQNTIKQSVEKARLLIEWKKRDNDELCELLKQ